MRKGFSIIYFLITAVLVLSLSGCNGSSSSFVGTTKPAVKQVAVLTSPVFQQGSDYVMYKGASVSEMDGAKYYVAPDVGTDADKATLNLGFTEELDESLIIAKVVNNQEQVVFAYNPDGSGDKTTGTLTPPSDGKRLKYDGLTIAQSFFTSINVVTENAKVIILDAEAGTATIDGAAIPEYDYVWHADPSYSDEYFTLGSSTEKLTKKQVKAAISDAVYVARDIRYMPNNINFTGTATKDGETEYAAYYSDEVAAEMAAEYGSEFAGPYIFATLPTSNGMGGNPGGGGFPGGTSGDTPPNFPGGMSGDNRPNFPGGMSGDNRPAFPGGNPPSDMPGFRASTSNSDVALFSTMTHSSSEAYANRVLHITEPGIYSLKGTWKGQIWIEIGEDSSDKAAIILNGVTVSCDVAPALVFKEVYECGPGEDEEETVAATWKTLGTDVLSDAGAMVVIADDTVNNFTGTNVYRLLKAEPKSSATKIDGTDISDQKKRYKMDGAFYSFMSLAMAGGTKANGVLNVTSTTYEGLDAEIHMTLESGVVNVTAVDDGMNFNEDDISVFTMLGGTLTVSSQNGDGIDSNGYVYINGGTLNITAGTQKIFSAGEAGIDAEDGCEVTSNATYNWSAASGNNTPTNPTNPTNPTSGDNPPNVPSNPNSGDNPPNIPSEPNSGDNTPNIPNVPSGSIAITTTSLQNGTVGMYYSQTLTASETATWTLTNGTLPAGLTLSPLGTIQGNPTAAGSSTFTLTATGDSGSTQKTFTITINAASSTSSPDVTPPAPQSQDVPPPAPTPGSNDIPAPNPQSQDIPAPAPTPTPENTPDPTPDETVNTETISAPNGTTTVQIALGSSTLAEDTDTSPRGIAETSNVFRITRKVNTFSGITTEN